MAGKLIGIAFVVAGNAGGTAFVPPVQMPANLTALHALIAAEVGVAVGYAAALLRQLGYGAQPLVQIGAAWCLPGLRLMGIWHQIYGQYPWRFVVCFNGSGQKEEVQQCGNQ